MRPLSYAKRLTSDLETWVNKGWVTPDNAEHIRASLHSEEGSSRLPVVITILGTVLIGFSVMAFVAANWAAMPKGLRLGLLGVTMWSTYGGAAYLLLRKQSGYAEAALLAGVAFFGANIMLIGQMYHLPSDFSAGLLAWALGALVTAWAVKSRSALVATQLLLMGWTSNELTDGTLHVAYLVPWAAATLLAVRLNWNPARHLALIGLIFWMLGNVPSLAERIGWGPFEALITLAALFVLLWVVGLATEQKEHPFSRALQAYGALATFILFGIAQLIDEGLKGQTEMIVPALSVLLVPLAAYAVSIKQHALLPLDIAALTTFPLALVFAGLLMPTEGTYTGTAPLWFTAPILLLLSVWLVAFGTRTHNRFLINLGFAAFGAEALFLYLETFGTLLDTAAFFAIGGILLIAGGFVWERLRRQATSAQEEASS